MKINFLTIFTLILIIGQIKAQGPTLSLVGSSQSLTKGTINSEVLTEIIQTKQEEVKQRVFRNTIIKQFNDGNVNENLKNFTTYHYLYKLMDVMTTGKNKTAITKAITENTTEFAYAFGLAMYLQKNIEVNSSAVKTFGEISLSSYFIDSAEVRYTSDRIILSKNIKDFNLLIDLCFDVLLTDPNLQKTFNLSDKLADDNFKTWFENDNVYYLDSLNADATKRAELISLRSEVISRLGGLTNLIQKSIIPFSTNTINELTKLKEINKRINEILIGDCKRNCFI